MIFATVEFPADRSMIVDLHDEGWIMRGERTAWDRAMESLISRMASTDDYGPSDGDPVQGAADVAAALLDGAVTFVRHPDPVPHDAVY